MDYELFKKIIDQIAEFPNKLKKLALYMRGEPLLHKKLPDMISYAKKKNVSELIQVTTNGYLLSPEMNLKLIESGLDELVVSIEALSPEKYEEITRVYIDYDKFIDNIRNFYKNKSMCKLYIKILDVGLNYDEEYKFHEIFDDICDKAFIEDTLPQYRQVSYSEVKHDFKTDVRGNELLKVDVCTQPFLSLYVLHNGDVCVCCVDYSGKIVFGNITDQSLFDIWNGQALKNFRMIQLQRKRDLHFECGKCDYPIYNTPKTDILDNDIDEVLSYFSC
jgi:radical SAM protein with 4Fe4S-binding SPASM domain